MDPISALGVAAAVVQFVELATRRCRDVLSLYETGDLAFFKGVTFDHTARDFLDFSEDFRTTQKLNPATHDLYGKTDDAIDQLIAGCSGVAHETATIFQKLDQLRQSNHTGSKLVALMKAAWKYDDITRLMEKMATYQSQLVLRMLQHLSLATVDTSRSNRQRFDNLDQQYSEIVQVLAVTNNRIENMGNQGAALRRRLDETDAHSVAHHNRVLSAILTLQSGETRVIAPKGAYQQDLDDCGQSLVTLTTGGHDTWGHAELRGFEPIQGMVLRSLYFRHYSDRYDSVKLAHASTFNWILEDTPNVERPWASLVRWLEIGSGCYWINGKAGSGKSTLMKYLLRDPRTKSALRKWTGSPQSEATIASFFFWNLGSSTQKSQEGLLRSLLYDILSQHPCLIPSVMPELRILGANLSKRNHLEAPSFAELLHWFYRLLDQTNPKFRLFFVIDGIDEYEGDPVEVVNLLASVRKYPDVKFLVSSRPLPICVDAFSDFPNLRLQDLTKNDIRGYTEELLRKRLESRYSEEWANFAEAIVEKSCGVFLWVELVVRSLLTGLQNFDDISELWHRLDQSPSELKDLYAAMFRHMAPAYRKQASELFQICLIATETQNGWNHLTPIQLHFTGWDADATVKMPVKPLSIANEQYMVEMTEGRIRSRCAGILELRSVNLEMQGVFRSKPIKHFYVDFIHRTAVEFLQLPEIWEEVCLLTADTNFHPAVRLCHSCVLLCKSAPRESPIVVNESDIWYYMDRAMHYASLAERDGKPVSSSVLLDLDTTMSKHWREVDICYVAQEAIDATNGSHSELRRLQGISHCNTKNLHWASGNTLKLEEQLAQDERLAKKEGPLSKSYLLGAATPVDFYSLTVFYCLTSFLQGMLPQPAVSGEQGGDLASRLLFDATNNMLFRRPWQGTPEHREYMALACPAICSLLLEHGADPNAQFGISRESAWGLMLEYGLTNHPRKAEFWRNFDFRGFAYTYSRLLVNFVLHGADVNTEVVSKHPRGWDMRGYRPTYSALGAVEALYSPVDSMDPFAFSSHSSVGAGNRSQELISFYEHLVYLMTQNGAVRQLASRGRASQDTLSQGNRYSRQSMLVPPGTPPRPKSADAMKSKLKGMFGRWHNPKGSVET